MWIVSEMTQNVIECSRCVPPHDIYDMSHPLNSVKDRINGEREVATVAVPSKSERYFD